MTKQKHDKQTSHGKDAFALTNLWRMWRELYKTSDLIIYFILSDDFFSRQFCGLEKR